MNLLLQRLKCWRGIPWAWLVGAATTLAIVVATLVPSLANSPKGSLYTPMGDGDYTFSETNRRGMTERITYDFPDTGLKLTMPRFLKNPEAIQTPGKDIVVFLRTIPDTCGLYEMSETILPPNAGPPPHFHLDNDEWFFSTENSQIRLYSAQEKQQTIKAGQVPGINLAPIKMGSLVQKQGEILFSPKGSVHFFRNETPGKEDVRGFYNVWSPGYGTLERFQGINRIDHGNEPLALPEDQAVLLQSSLWGFPHDITGRFVGVKDFYGIRGPVFEHPNNVQKLQELFDAGEACYPPDGLRKPKPPLPEPQ
ncbi:hypothetical protein IQ219_05830 [Synechocystis sp. LEGE 06083]|uniref:hypothetical protein n=1 Tax=Synechocystis sp. LEGE 06083 TaxID=915336 RepID=UPI00187F6AFB|nr:hypothetical protein [Synechocystis sp. LEGE 06083]MBE9194836.1 hypothetical protein [Synechocystis sp. LEGE 06083]